MKAVVKELILGVVEHALDEAASRIDAEAGPTEDLSTDQLSENFRASEFACNCCGKLPNDKRPPQKLLDLLEALRDEYDAPVVVNSGYRCPRHNANVGGAKHSRHLKGDAADIVVKGVSPTDVYAVADAMVGDSGGVGRYNSFTHIDVRGTKARW